MHGFIVTALTANALLTLFIVIGLGYLLGEISFFGFRFGIVGVLFVGLAVGSLGPSISVPEVISTHATREAESDEPSIAYAAVYPFTTIAKIILAQLLTYPFSRKRGFSNYQFAELCWRI